MHANPPRTMARAAQVQWASGLNVLAGIWLIISPWVLGFSRTDVPMMWNNVIFGIIAAILAGIRAGGAYDAPWLSWINVLIGIWLFISAFVFATMAMPTPFWNNVILGIIVFVLGIVSALGSRRVGDRLGA
ncbi:MAG TPA: SPW repeat protein [Chloroflexota bacterium]|nr:SPW repeat protein [Chloroflexota bacterium]